MSGAAAEGVARRRPGAAEAPPAPGRPDPDRTCREVARRRMPYPYRALLAISSDLDETPDRSVYLESMRFLNTLDAGPMGPGLGLEVGNSIYFDAFPGQFAYWSDGEVGRAMVHALIRSGHIDVLHSFGDLASARADAARALESLERHRCRLEVWVDHAVAPTNLDGDIMKGSGDVVSSPAYHADLSVAHGIQYVWRGRVTSVVGQGVPWTPRGIFTARHAVASGRTLAKELAKRALAAVGHAKYAMHGPNEVLRRVCLRSGHEVHEFMRSNPHWGGVSSHETAGGLADVLVPGMLDRLVQREGVCLLYTHLGKIARREEPFAAPTRQALSRLAGFHRAGRILVTTTRRALGYCRTAQEVAWAVSVAPDGALHLALRSGSAPALSAADLDGLSFYVPDPARVRVTAEGREITDLRRNPPDHTGRPSVSLPWRRLEFPL
ncbi:MAG TPA: hypothetical protein VMT79_21970 [Candidatus Binatia bacterium]|nr:hypothetical protein [Candidatus Binatia bacterium]